VKNVNLKIDSGICVNRKEKGQVAILVKCCKVIFKTYCANRIYKKKDCMQVRMLQNVSEVLSTVD
jgi:hypothetical protein